MKPKEEANSKKIISHVTEYNKIGKNPETPFEKVKASIKKYKQSSVCSHID